MPIKWRFAWALVLALLASPAFALGLGPIQVRSQFGEPFLAEIPIVSSDPSELRQLQARLASADTFTRIGLEPPQGLVQDLQFSVALDAAGRPVIRVTSAAPVEQPLLTFLIEADWGQGRLVREYSALLQAPETIAAPAQPPIQAPASDPGNRIVRPESLPHSVTAAPGPPPEATAATLPGEAPAAEEPAAPAAAPAPASVAADSAAARYGPVQSGETLSEIVHRMARDADVTANQMMLALLRTNPAAFIGGNINLLREGAILRMPEPDDVRSLTAAEASAEVRAQVARWRELSAPSAQPTGAALASTGSPASASAAAAPDPRTVGARLEIAPPVAADGQQAGTRSGISAGGEGEMLRQELQETRETLAARDAEVEELRARLAELERIQGQQQRLIALKDSELAAVQERLAESNQASVPGLAPAAQAGAPEPPAAGAPWLWIALALVVFAAAALAWRRSRRDAVVAARPRPTGRLDPPAGAAGSHRATPLPPWHAGAGSAAPAGDLPASAPAPEDGSGAEAGSARAVPPAVPSGGWSDDSAPVESPAVLAGAAERLELARAYVELGDIETARSLLEEVVGDGAGAASEEAARLLRGLA